MEESQCPKAKDRRHAWGKYPVDPVTGARISVKAFNRYGAFEYRFGRFCMRCGQRKADDLETEMSAIDLLCD